ncbi:MAG: low molecular weight phosphotyrosine protein phosphatase [Gammaproteobacteria bacterium]|nr:low molecular weight phosphotyrosine protein phosphatase [Gammaproteobacteria bacterium]MBU1654330.1 low molecular weight phosphotyrosine protein phosphatase [Gammaproteobacteria bacterium]MBU1961353.1 low molecular weight phosphotyrosine protein phosphatase [Gammaproteobacteria bacterium]
MKKIGILFVCMGNICRSPTAHGVFRHLVVQAGLMDSIEVDSAGTQGYHVGAPPDSRSQATARGRGLDLGDLRARKAIAADFNRFDYILAMDRANYQGLREICPSGHERRLRMFLEFAPELGIEEVPDPYYGGQRGFEDVFDMATQASQGLLDYIRGRHVF